MPVRSWPRLLELDPCPDEFILRSLDHAEEPLSVVLDALLKRRIDLDALGGDLSDFPARGSKLVLVRDRSVGKGLHR